MNKDNELKKFALYYVAEHDNLSKEEKLKIGNFIMESNIELVNYLLCTGKMKTKLTEADKTLLEDWEPSSHLHSPKWGEFGDLFVGKNYMAGIKTGIQVSVLVAAAAVSAVKVYKSFFSKAARACKDKKGVTKTDCMNKFKQQAQKAKIQFLQSALTKCSKSKDPSTCKTKLQHRINQEKSKMGAL